MTRKINKIKQQRQGSHIPRPNKNRTHLPYDYDSKLNYSNGLIAQRDYEDFLVFDYSLFQLESTSINKFNNHFSDAPHALSVFVAFFNTVLKELSQKTRKEVFTNRSRARVLHIHPITDDEHIAIIEKILASYDLKPELIIDDGSDLYQIRGSMDSKAPRIVFVLVGKTVRFLFFDTNHHIYPDKDRDHGGTFDYRFCPVCGLK